MTCGEDGEKKKSSRLEVAVVGCIGGIILSVLGSNLISRYEAVGEITEKNKPWAVSGYDLNGDSYEDVIVTNPAGKHYIFLRNEDGKFDLLEDIHENENAFSLERQASEKASFYEKADSITRGYVNRGRQTSTLDEDVVNYGL